MKKQHITSLHLGASLNRLRFRQKGYTLIELMVSLAIGVLVMASALMITVASSQSGRVSDAETAMNEDGMIALGLLQQQIRLAGYSKTVRKDATSPDLVNFVGASIRGCDFGFVAADAEFDALTCATSGDAGSAFAVRYEADTFNTMPVGSTPSPSNCAIAKIESYATSAVAGTYPFG